MALTFSSLARRRPSAAAAALTVAAALLSCGKSAVPGVPTSPASPAEIVAYHDSGQWARDTSAVIADAHAFLDRRLDADDVRRPAVVLDVDDTSLSSYECLKDMDFERSPDSPCARMAELPAIPQTLELFRYARDRDVAVVFITGRRERLRRATISNLRAAGYTGRWRLVMRPNRERPGTHEGFKARQRGRIERGGHTVVVNVGDQRSDLSGGGALRAFKLPNPMYVIPSA